MSVVFTAQGRTITLKIKKVNFEVHSHAESVSGPVSSSEELFRSAKQLLRAEIAACQPNPLRLRLMGEDHLNHTQ